MKIQANLKCWGVELEISTNNVVLNEDLGKSESGDISEQMLDTSKDLYKYSTDKSDLDYSKYVVDKLQLSDWEIEELISYLQTKIAD